MLSAAPRMASFARREVIGMQPASAQEGMEQAVPVVALVDDEADGPRTGELEDDRVDPGDVIGQKEEAARAASCFLPGGGDAIDEPREPQADEVEERVRANEECAIVYDLQLARRLLQSAIP